MLKLENISYSENGKTIFENINFEAVQGEKIVLLGQNGSGKSTLFSLINALIFPQTGKLLFNDQEINSKSLKNKNFSKQFRSETGLVFQDPESMLFHPTVYDELALGPKQRGLDNLDKIVQECAVNFRITHLLQKAPYELSGGERQKVALACVMVNQPKLLLLDEPSANLDPASTGWLIDTIRNLAGTVITSVHHLSMAKELGDRAIVLGEGTVLFDGPIEEFYNDIDLMVRAGLAHKHKHHEDNKWHVHDWE